LHKVDYFAHAFVYAIEHALLNDWGKPIIRNCTCNCLWRKV